MNVRSHVFLDNGIVGDIIDHVLDNVFRYHVENGDVHKISKMVKSFDVNGRSISSGQTPLMISRCPEITKILLESGADPNLQNREGNTARVAQIPQIYYKKSSIFEIFNNISNIIFSILNFQL